MTSAVSNAAGATPINGPTVPQTTAPAFHDFGVPSPDVQVRPALYDTSIKGVRDVENVPTHYLPYEWSEAVRVDPDDPLQWHSFMARATERIEKAMDEVKGMMNMRLPAEPRDATQTLKQAFLSARGKIDANMNHDPAGELFKRNRVPRFAPEGAAIEGYKMTEMGLMHADDAKQQAIDGTRLVFDLPSQAQMETLLFRVPAEHIDQQHWEGIDEAAESLNKAVNWLSWSDSETGVPSMSKSYKELRNAKKQLTSALRDAGAEGFDSSPLNRLWNRVLEMTPGEARTALIGGGVAAALIGGGIAAKVAFRTDD